MKKFIKLIPVFLLFCLTSITVKAQDSTSLCLEELNTDVYEDILTEYYEVEAGYAYCSSAVNLTSSVEITEDVSVTIPDAYGSNVWRVDTSLDTADSNCTVVELNNNFYYLSAVSNAVFNEEGVTFSTNKLGIYIAGGCFSEEDIENFSTGTSNFSIDETSLTKDGTWLGASYSLLDEDEDGVKETCYVYGTITDTTSIYGPLYSKPKPNYQTYGFYKVLNDHPDVTKAVINCSLGTRTNLRDLFTNCTQLVSLEFGTNFDTSKVADMSYMFYKCSSLTTLDVSIFNTSKVTNMCDMFYKCSSLTTLDVSNFNTSNVSNMNDMFYYCKSLTTLDVSNFNTSNVIVMNYMFYYCSSLTSLHLSNFNTSNVTTMREMFRYCSALTTLDVSNFNTSNVTVMYKMFSGCKLLTTLDVSNFNTSKVKSMSGMFYDCSALTSLDVSNFDTSSVHSMDEMFYNCSSLTTLNLSNFNTSNVNDMRSMFKVCGSLTTLDVSNFDTSNVTTMRGMFSSCKSLTTLNLSNFNTSKVTDMGFMFNDCKALTSLDLSNFNTSSVTNMEAMFQRCNALTTLDISSFNTSNVTNMQYMFFYCNSLTTLDVSNFYTSKVTNMEGMFDSCKALTSLDLSKFNTSNVTIMKCMFSYCDSLTTLDLSNFDTTNVTDMSNMFCGCNSLTTLDLSSFDMSYVTKYTSMFYNCNALETLKTPSTNSITNISMPKTMYTWPDNTPYTTLPVTTGTSLELHNITRDGEWLGAYYSLLDKDGDGVKETCYVFGTITDNTEIYGPSFVSPEPNYQTYGFYKVLSDHPDVTKAIINCSLGTRTSTHCLFDKCTQLVSLEFGTNFDTSNVTIMAYMFNNCNSLTTLDVSSFNTSNVNNMDSMFYNCKLLTLLDVSNFNTSKVTRMDDIFRGCSSLTTLDVSNFDTSKVTYMTCMFDGCKSLTALNISNFNTSKVTRMDSMFDGCSSLTTLDLSNFNTSNVTKMNSMFSDCSSLTSLDLSSFNSSNVTNMSWMFDGCSSLTTLDISNLNTSNVTAMVSIFRGCSSLTILDVSNFDTSNITNMEYMFSNCSSLTSLDLSNFNTSKVTRMDYMFSNCSSLTSLDLSNFNTSNVTNMHSMFSFCKSVISLDLSNFNTSNVTDMAYMFSDCNKLTSLDLSGFNMSAVTEYAQMFTNCHALDKVILPINVGTCSINLPKTFYGYAQDDTRPDKPQSYNVLPAADASTRLHYISGTKYVAIDALLKDAANADYFLGVEHTSFKRENIASINFITNSTLTSSDTVEDAVHGILDVSLIGDEGVFAYSKVSLNEGLYDIYVVTKYDKIYTNANVDGGAKYLFKGLYNCDSITGLEYLNLSRSSTAEGMFSDYAPEIFLDPIVQYAHSSNVDETGNSTSSTYSNNLKEVKNVSIPGAAKLEITITLQTESTTYDFVAIYPGNVTPSFTSNSSNNLSEATISNGKIGGSTKTTKTFTYEGDSINILFRTDGSGNKYYGYYAVVTAYNADNNVISTTVSLPKKELDLSNLNLPSGINTTDFLTDCGNLTELVTPSTNTIDNIALPITMYTWPDKTSYTVMPTTSGTSVTLHDSDVVPFMLNTAGDLYGTIDPVTKVLTITGTGIALDIKLSEALGSEWSSITGIVFDTQTIQEIGNNWCDLTVALTNSKLSGDLVLPTSLVTIGNDAFGFCTFDGTLTIPDSVTTIGDNAFIFCDFTGSLNLPENLQSIGNGAFAYCRRFTGELMLPNSVTTVGSNAFYSCKGFTGTLTISSGMSTIADSTFYKCSGFTKLVISDSVTEIKQKAFFGCNAIADITIGTGLTTIGNEAFACVVADNSSESGYSLVETPISTFLQTTNEVALAYDWASDGRDASVRYILNISGDLYGDLNLTTGVLTIKGTGTKLDKYLYNVLGEDHELVTGLVFDTTTLEYICGGWLHSTYYNSSTKETEYRFPNLVGELVLPNSVNYIGNKAFNGCSGFTGDLIIPEGVTEINDHAFCNCTGFNGTLTLPSTLETIGIFAFSNCGFTGSLVIPEGVTNIGYSAFDSCKGFTGDLVIPDSVITIGTMELDNGCFKNCTGFNGNLILGSNLVTIGRASFSGCTGLTGDLIIPDSVTTLGRLAFNKCSGFNGTLTISNNLTVIDDHVFTDCKNLSGSLNIPSSITSIGYMSFENCVGFTGDLIIPNTVSSLDTRSFYNCSGFNGKLILSDQLTEIPINTFAYCSGLTGDLVIPDNVTTIGASAFSRCTGFNGTLTLSSNLITIKDDAFYHCENITGNLMIPDSVTVIEHDAFSNCSKLNGLLKLSSNIESIGSYAFAFCTNLKRYYIDDGLTSIGNKCFYTNTKTPTKLYTTNEIVKNYDWAGDNRTILPMNTFTFALPQDISLKPKYLNVADAPVFYSAFNMEITGDFEDGSYGTFEGVPSFTISAESGETRTVTTNVEGATISEDGTITVPVIFTAPNPTLNEEFSGQFQLPTVLHEVLPFAS